MMVAVTPDAPGSTDHSDASDHSDDPDERDTSDILDLSHLSRAQALRLAARAPDSYVLLLFLLVADYVLLTVGWSGGAALVARTVLFALTVLLAFHTSRVEVPYTSVWMSATASRCRRLLVDARSTPSGRSTRASSRPASAGSGTW